MGIGIAFPILDFIRYACAFFFVGQGFSVKRADREDIKRILAVYYEQNVITERFEDFDGERWIMPED